MITNTLGRYFAGKFACTAIAVFSGIFLLVLLIDYIEMSRRTSGIAAASAGLVALTSAYRVPQLLERTTPFCVLVATMVCLSAFRGATNWSSRAPPEFPPGSSSRRRW